jgi:hypothetical protein
MICQTVSILGDRFFISRAIFAPKNSKNAILEAKKGQTQWKPEAI